MTQLTTKLAAVAVLVFGLGLNSAHAAGQTFGQPPASHATFQQLGEILRGLNYNVETKTDETGRVVFYAVTVNITEDAKFFFLAIPSNNGSEFQFIVPLVKLSSLDGVSTSVLRSLKGLNDKMYPACFVHMQGLGYLCLTMPVSADGLTPISLQQAVVRLVRTYVQTHEVWGAIK